MILPEMEKFALKKGIDVLTASDFTHPLWFRELKSQLVEDTEGIYKLKTSKNKVRFILSTEISSIYSQGGKTRRVHNLVFAPSIATVEKINAELIKRGCNLNADGRPIVGLSSRNLLDLVLTIDPKAFLIPCHVWTPWFSLYGSFSGFDSIDECFQDLSKEIYGVETGLSSDPEMNWRIKELETRSILSFSDAHSAIKMGREATVFVTKDGISNNPISNKQITFNNIKSAIKRDPKSNLEIGYTIEFYPEEGKYHYTGHRNCKITQTPEQTKKNGVICPVCKRGLTVGVMERVEKLASVPTSIKTSVDKLGVTWVEDPRGLHPKYVKLVPLIEIIAESVGVMPGSLKVIARYEEMVQSLGSELKVLIKTPIPEIEIKFGEKIAEGIDKVRRQDIYVNPGFDGEYGKVKIWNSEEDKSQTKVEKEEKQLGLF